MLLCRPMLVCLIALSQLVLPAAWPPPAVAESPPPKDSILIEVAGGEEAGDAAAFRPLDYSVVGTVVPRLRIRGELDPGARIFHFRADRRAGISDGQSPNGREITELFHVDSDALIAEVAMLVGVNSVLITGADGDQLLAAVTMINYAQTFEDVNGNGVLDPGEDADGDGELDEGEDLNGNGLLDLAEDLDRDGRLDTGEDMNLDGLLDPGEDLNANGLLDTVPRGLARDDPGLLSLIMVEGATDREISEWLRGGRLRPLGISFDISSPAANMRIDALPENLTPAEALEKLNGFELEDLADWDGSPVAPPLLVAAPKIRIVPLVSSGKSLPPRLVDGADAPPSFGNAGDRYDPRRGGYEDDGDFDGLIDNDRDGKDDEDPRGDDSADGFPGKKGLDDNAADGIDFNDAKYYPCFLARQLHFDDDEDGKIDEDRRDLVDNDNDGRVDEDPPGDRNGDGFPGKRGLDDDGDNSIDFDDFAKLFAFANSRRRAIGRPVDDDDEDLQLDPACSVIAGGVDEDRSAASNVLEDFDEVDIAWPHFAMETHAAHDLVDVFVAGRKALRRPGIAMLDDGLGRPEGALLDLPFARLLGITKAAELKQFRSAGSHGLTVSALAAGEGVRILGTGRHASIRPYQVLGHGSMSLTDALTQVAMAGDVHIVSKSFGMVRVDSNGDGVVSDLGDEDGDGKFDEDDVSFQRPFTFGNGLDDDGDGAIDEDLRKTEKERAKILAWAGTITLGGGFAALGRAGKILVSAAGNEPVDVSKRDGGVWYLDYPIRGERDPSHSGRLRMAVAASGMGLANEHRIGPEHRAEFSSRGDRISVSAPGDEMATLRRDQTFKPNTGGTSWSAPYVAGLAGEILFVDMNRDGDPVFGPQQVVELIEATADDLGSGLVQGVVGGRPTPGPYTNDHSGNGPDDYFGFGRINVWKGVLAAINQGIAAESHRRDTGRFGQLARIDEAGTAWYGFRVITPVKGATVWLDSKKLTTGGRQLPDPSKAAGAGQPASRTADITAFEGIASSQVITRGVDPDGDGILDEDPTTGFVPVGNEGGEFVATFSLERGDLMDGAKARTLTLRAPGQGVTDAPFFTLVLDLGKMRRGEVPGVSFDDFVFEITSPDFGDAPDFYPVALSDNGARHLNSHLEWLGTIDEKPWRQSVSPEHDAIDGADPDGQSNGVAGDTRASDRDRFDDGVVLKPLTYRPGQQGTLSFTACVADPHSGRYESGVAGRQLYVNGWIDWNANRRWELGGEHVVPGVALDPTGGKWSSSLATVKRTQISSGKRCGTFEATFQVPAGFDTRDQVWARFRLDFGENAGQLGAGDRLFKSLPGLFLAAGPARFGEVEDYFVGSDFGDAPDRYPSQKSKQGAYHLDGHKEFLGESVTREPDACLANNQASADQEGVPNLGFQPSCKHQDQDGGDETSAVFDAGSQTLRIDVLVQSTVSIHGYDVPGASGSSAQSVQVATLDPADSACQRLIDRAVLSTPAVSGGKGRYQGVAAVDDDRDGVVDEDSVDGVDADLDGLVDEDPSGRRALYLNIFVDWDEDGSWQGIGEWPVKNARIAAETFGADNAYTLGEPFVDANADGVWQAGENYSDSAGVDAQSYTCLFQAPSHLRPKELWVRSRLTWAERVDQSIEGGPGDSEIWVRTGLASATARGRTLSRDRGGALTGEVEDTLASCGIPASYRDAIAEIELSGPEGPELITVEGRFAYDLAIGCDGEAGDGDGDSLDDVPITVRHLLLSGASRLGPVRAGLQADRPSDGRLTELHNAVAGVLDTPPFGEGEGAAAAVELHLELDIGETTLVAEEPLVVKVKLAETRAGSEPWKLTNPVPWLDLEGEPSGWTLESLTLIAAPYGSPVEE